MLGFACFLLAIRYICFLWVTCVLLLAAVVLWSWLCPAWFFPSSSFQFLVDGAGVSACSFVSVIAITIAITERKLQAEPPSTIHQKLKSEKTERTQRTSQGPQEQRPQEAAHTSLPIYTCIQ